MRIAKTNWPVRFCLAFPVPMTQSPTEAIFRIRGLHVASVQTPKNGFGANP